MHRFLNVSETRCRVLGVEWKPIPFLITSPVRSINPIPLTPVFIQQQQQASQA